MLEDGEIGEDDFQNQSLKSDLIKASPQATTSPLQKKNKRNKNKQREIKRKKILTNESSPSTEDDSIVAINDILFSNKDHDSRLDSNQLDNNNHTDKDERHQQPKFLSNIYYFSV